MNSFSLQKLAFTGKTLAIMPEELCSKGREVVSKNIEHVGSKVKSNSKVPAETYKAYSNVNCKRVNLARKEFGYAVGEHSVELPIYKGPKNKSVGLSTEVGGLGRGWLKASIDTPLSTADIHTCAVLHLVNEEDGQHVLYHVLHKTPPEEIQKFMKDNFPKFNKVNILPGDMLYETRDTVNAIISAVDRVNPKAEKKFYHFATENPEVVAYKGKLSYVKGHKPEHVTFTELAQYYYPEENLVKP